jgi:thiol-disulfide isomerase/thioredoxin
MKQHILFSVLMVTSITLSAQDPVELIHKSFSKCQSVKSGYYEMTFFMHYMDEHDSPITPFTCHFKKLADDSIYSSAFHYSQLYEDGEKKYVLYTGNEFVNYFIGDSTGTIMRKPEWASEIKSYSHNYTFYSPLTNRKSRPLPDESSLTDSLYIFSYIGEEDVNDFHCYHVQVNEIPVNEPDDDYQTLRQEFHFWINTDDYIPVQFTIAFDMLMNNDTMYQFERYTLDKYELELQDIDQYIGLASIPSYVKLEEYKPYEPPPLLPADTIAPVWKLPDLKGDSVSLMDLKGNIVLVDFFYKSCYPCMQALPALQQLHEKYGDKGVRVIGIDPYDTIEEGIEEFLAKRGVTYTVLLGGREVAKTYRVSGYPTMYLIDQIGKVITVQVGFGEGVEEELEKIILEHLD